MRLRQPEALPPYKGMYYAQSFGKSCPQQKFTIPSVVRRKRDRQDISDVLNLMYGGLVPDEEDCKAYVTSPARVELNSFPRPDHKRREAFKCHTFIQSPCRRCKYHHTFPVPCHSFKRYRIQWIFGGAFQIGGTSTFVPIICCR